MSGALEDGGAEPEMGLDAAGRCKVGAGVEAVEVEAVAAGVADAEGSAVVDAELVLIMASTSS